MLTCIFKCDQYNSGLWKYIKLSCAEILISYIFHLVEHYQVSLKRYQHDSARLRTDLSLEIHRAIIYFIFIYIKPVFPVIILRKCEPHQS